MVPSEPSLYPGFFQMTSTCLGCCSGVDVVIWSGYRVRWLAVARKVKNLKNVIAMKTEGRPQEKAAVRDNLHSIFRENLRVAP